MELSTGGRLFCQGRFEPAGWLVCLSVGRQAGSLHHKIGFVDAAGERLKGKAITAVRFPGFGKLGCRDDGLMTRVGGVGGEV
jgi:hypothetical protein